MNTQTTTPPTNIFGQWAHHKTHGWSIIISTTPNPKGKITIACEDATFTSLAKIHRVNISELTLTPKQLTTEEQFQAAPIGTILQLADSLIARKHHKDEWVVEAMNRNLTNAHMAEMRPWYIVRIGTPLCDQTQDNPKPKTPKH